MHERQKVSPGETFRISPLPKPHLCTSDMLARLISRKSCATSGSDDRRYVGSSALAADRQRFTDWCGLKCPILIGPSKSDARSALWHYIQCMKALFVLLATCALFFASARSAAAQFVFSFGGGPYYPSYGGYCDCPGYYGYYPSYYSYGWGGYYRPWWRHRYYGGYYGGWGGRGWGGGWHGGRAGWHGSGRGWHGGGGHGHH
jgi:hypothetical protein